MRATTANTKKDSGASKLAGFTLIELMIVIATLAILMTMALPLYSNYTIRAKLAEALSVANTTKTSLAATCNESPRLLNVRNKLAGHFFEEGVGDGYVENVEIGGTCSNPQITITTRNTGQSPDPVLALQGSLEPASGQMTWTCFSANTPGWLLPKRCRS